MERMREECKHLNREAISDPIAGKLVFKCIACGKVLEEIKIEEPVRCETREART